MEQPPSKQVKVSTSDLDWSFFKKAADIPKESPNAASVTSSAFSTSTISAEQVTQKKIVSWDIPEVETKKRSRDHEEKEKEKQKEEDESANVVEAQNQDEANRIIELLLKDTTKDTEDSGRYFDGGKQQPSKATGNNNNSNTFKKPTIMPTKKTAKDPLNTSEDQELDDLLLHAETPAPPPQQVAVAQKTDKKKSKFVF